MSDTLIESKCNDYSKIANNELSEIQNFYDDTTILITGGTGFLGRLLIEKLLRTCYTLRKIILLARPKKGKCIEERIEELFNVMVFNRLKQEQPNFAKKIVLISGDCALPNLGINDNDLSTIIQEVDCIFHVAATVRFDEKLRNAINTNVRATYDILKLAREMKKIKSIVHVSTAYSFCQRKEIDEFFYRPRISGIKSLNLADALEDDILDKITPTLLGEWPNTYAFTKALAEDVIKTEGQGLPIIVVRPSIVLSTAKEPVPGWIDNFYGCSGIIVGVALGLIRTLHCNLSNVAELIPADYVINCLVAAGWDVGVNKANQGTQDFKQIEEDGKEAKNDVKILNCVSSPQRPLTWKNYTGLAEVYLKKIPSPLLIWHYVFYTHTNKYIYLLYAFFLQTIPSYIVDFLAVCVRKKPMMRAAYKKINKFTEAVSYFTTREWKFTNHNTQAVWKRLTEKDKKLFDFNIGDFVWDRFFPNYSYGIRIHLLKDPMETLPQGRVHYRRLQLAHYVLVTLLSLLLLKLYWSIWSRIFD